MCISDVESLTLAKALPAVPVRLEGRVSGTVAATLAATPPDKPRDTSARVELTAPRLRVQNIPTQKVRADVTYRSGKADYRLEGESLGGTFKLEGSVPATAEKDAPEGKLTIENVRLSRLGDVFGGQETPNSAGRPTLGGPHLSARWAESGASRIRPAKDIERPLGRP